MYGRLRPSRRSTSTGKYAAVSAPAPARSTPRPRGTTSVPNATAGAVFSARSRARSALRVCADRHPVNVRRRIRIKDRSGNVLSLACAARPHVLERALVGFHLIRGPRRRNQFVPPGRQRREPVDRPSARGSAGNAVTRAKYSSWPSGANVPRAYSSASGVSLRTCRWWSFTLWIGIVLSSRAVRAASASVLARRAERSGARRGRPPDIHAPPSRWQT